MNAVHAFTLAAALAAGSAAAPGAAPHLRVTSFDVQQPGPSDASLKRARELVDQARYDEATALVDQWLSVAPRDARLYRLKIEARAAAHDHEGALAAYDDFIAVTQADDAELLALVARSELGRIARQESPERYLALEALAASGDNDSKQELEALAKQSKDPGKAAAAVASLARAGDADAQKQLIQRARNGERAALTTVLSWPRATFVLPQGERSVIAEGLRHSDTLVQDRALEAAAASGDASLTELVRALSDSADRVVKLQAAVALYRLGETTSDALLRAHLESGIPDAQIRAARAYAGADGPWKAAIRPLLENQDATNRIDAAELLLDEPSAVEVLQSALGDPNLYVRSEALRVLTRGKEPPLPLLRPLLKDPSTLVRLRVASALVAPAGPR